MQQEDYNSVMKYPWEIIRKPHNEKLPDCPRCGEPYCGDGTQLCVECNLMIRERFEELAKLKGMDVTRANRRITFVNLEAIETGEYISRMTEAAWWGWQEAMKEDGDE